MDPATEMPHEQINKLKGILINSLILQNNQYLDTLFILSPKLASCTSNETKNVNLHFSDGIFFRPQQSMQREMKTCHAERMSAGGTRTHDPIRTSTVL